jgi:hypothetical protein
VKVESIGRSDEGRELVVVWVTSDDNIKNLQRNRDNLAKIADPRGLTPEQVRQLVTTTKPHYHFMGGLHSGETGPSEMLMELAAWPPETSPLIKQIRDNVIVSITPVADPDGRDRNVDWFYKGLEEQTAAGGPASPQRPQGAEAGATGAQGAGAAAAEGAPGAGAGGGRGGGQLPYGAVTSSTTTRHQPVAGVARAGGLVLTAPADHARPARGAGADTPTAAVRPESNLDPILFTELPFFSNFELSQMTKWGMPGVSRTRSGRRFMPGYSVRSPTTTTA